MSAVRFAARSLVRRPSISLLIIFTLGLGMGANSAIFSLAHRVLMAPYDLPDVDRVVTMQQKTVRGMFTQTVTRAAFLAARESAKSVHLAAYELGTATTRASEGTRPVHAAAVSDGFFDVVGVSPFLGRAFSSEEAAGRGAAVVILGHALWQAQFGSDPTIVGRTLSVDGAPHVVVGVMPASRAFPTGTEMWRPLVFSAADLEDRTKQPLGTIGRLEPGASVDQARAELAALAARDVADHPDIAPRATRVIMLNASIVDDNDKPFMFIVFATSLLVLLIACANVANVFLAAVTVRRREHAVRAALGAGRGRIILELLCETILLGICASVVALLVAAWGTDLIHNLVPSAQMAFIPGWDRLGVDHTVLGYTLAAGLATGVIFGIVPAVQVSRTNLHDVLKAGGRGGESAGTHRLRGALVVGQIALAMCLVVASAGLVRAFRTMADPARGMDPTRIATALVEVPAPRTERDLLPALATRLVERLRALPGVEDAALSNQVPWGANSVSRVPLVAGRNLDERDVADARRVAVLSAAAARVYFPDEDPLGKRVVLDGLDGDAATIVGVVGDVRERWGSMTPSPNIYVPFAQRPEPKFYVAVRTTGAPETLLDEVRTTVGDVNPSLAVSHEDSLVGVMAEATWGLGTVLRLMGTFAGLALLLATVGIYGVIAFFVAQRTREIGVRVALGARERQVIALVVGRGARLAAMGIALGTVAAIALLKLMGAAIPGFIDASAPVYAGVALVIALAAVTASIVPARRAARVDPMVSLGDD